MDILKNQVFYGENPSISFPNGTQGIITYLDNLSLLNLCQTSKYMNNKIQTIIDLRGKFNEERRRIEYNNQRLEFFTKKEEWLKLRNNLTEEQKTFLDEEFLKTFDNNPSYDVLKKLTDLYNKGASSKVFSISPLDYNTLASFLQRREFDTQEEYEIAFDMIKIVFDSETDKKHLFNQMFDYTNPESVIQTCYVLVFNEFDFNDPFLSYHCEYGLKIFKLLHLYGIDENITEIILRSYTYAKESHPDFPLSENHEIRNYQKEFIKIVKDYVEFIKKDDYESYEEELIFSISHLIVNLKKISYDWDIFFETILRNHGMKFIKYLDNNIINKKELRKYLIHLKKKNLSNYDEMEIMLALVEKDNFKTVKSLISLNMNAKNYDQILNALSNKDCQKAKKLEEYILSIS